MLTAACNGMQTWGARWEATRQSASALQTAEAAEDSKLITIQCTSGSFFADHIRNGSHKSSLMSGMSEPRLTWDKTS